MPKKTPTKHASAGAARLAEYRARTARLDRQLPVETMERLKELAENRNQTIVAVLIDLIEGAAQKKKIVASPERDC
jgi:hypothetical protein